MPYAIHQSGVALGLVILVVVTLVTDAALCLMIAAARTVQANTYQELVRASFGKPGFIITTCLQFLYPFICEYLCVVVGRIDKINFASCIRRTNYVVLDVLRPVNYRKIHSKSCFLVYTMLQVTFFSLNITQIPVFCLT